MRSKIAVVLVILGLVVLGLGIGQRTIWLPPATITASVQGSVAPAPLTVIGPDVLNAKDGNFTMTIKAKGPIQLAVGQQRDISGWVGKAAHTDITGVNSDFTALAAKGVAGDAKVPNPAGSDMWVSEEKATGELSYTWQAPGHGDWALLLSSDGTAPAPTDISLTTDNDAGTPWAVPLMIIGSALLALAALLFFIAPRRPQAAVAGRRAAGRAPSDAATGTMEVEKILAAREQAARAREPKPATIADARRAARRNEAAVPVDGAAAPAATPGTEAGTDHATALPGAVLGGRRGTGAAATTAIPLPGTAPAASASGDEKPDGADAASDGGNEAVKPTGGNRDRNDGGDAGTPAGSGAAAQQPPAGGSPSADNAVAGGPGSGAAKGATTGTAKGGAKDNNGKGAKGTAKTGTGNKTKNNAKGGAKGKPGAGKKEFTAGPAAVVRPQDRRISPVRLRWGAAVATVLVAGTVGPAMAADPTTPAAGPSASSTASASATEGATVGLPVLLDSQVQRIAAAVSTVVASGDSAKNAKELQSRVAGMALQVRAANYKIRSKVSTQAAPDPVQGTRLLARVVTTDSSWPRSAIFVTQGDGNALPQLLTLVQAGPRDNYKLVNASPLLPGQTFPQVDKEGAAGVPLDSATGLQMSPKAAIAALSDRLTKADSKWKSTFKDTVYIPSVLSTQANVLKEAKDASYVFSHTPDLKSALAMRTADGGAMVVVGYTFGIDATSKAEATLTIGPDAAVFAGGTTTTTGFVLQYGEPVVMYIPPASAKGQISIVSANRSLVGAKFK
ncbi:hypothetical protein [Arthrobacter sp. SDTb3-6]|uniref:hypothetical protein n=1 Tax=Arthrobacter sp. SDTb3-6 TaxID=2713571 RepID=UPI00159D0003|nr:hypothetical protein [Arthrobacter sp. SDTb3-6]NVM98872.1 hypothetical protein [Arthrobacter sp. SDTb3-6]